MGDGAAPAAVSTASPLPSICPSPATLDQPSCSSPGTPVLPPRARDASAELGSSSFLWVGSLLCWETPSLDDSLRQLLDITRHGCSWSLAPSWAAQPLRRVPSLLSHGDAGCKAEFYLQHMRTRFEECRLLAATSLTSVHCFHCNLLNAGPIPALPEHTRERGNNPAPLQLQHIRAFNWKEKLSHPSPHVTGLSPSKGFASGLCSGEFHNCFVFAKVPGWSLPSASRRGMSVCARGDMAHARACVLCWSFAQE